VSDFSGIGIHAREVGAFVKIALVARPRQIGQIICPAMLSGNDVVHVEWAIGVIRLRQAAVFAPVFRALSNQLTPWKVDPQAAEFFK
jgi:hypothetical protein